MEWGEREVEVGAPGSASLASSVPKGESPDRVARKWSSLNSIQVSHLFCNRASQTLIIPFYT